MMGSFTLRNRLFRNINENYNIHIEEINNNTTSGKAIMEVVQTLPTGQDIENNKIYLVPKETTNCVTTAYDTYAVVEKDEANVLEKIGGNMKIKESKLKKTTFICEYCGLPYSKSLSYKENGIELSFKCSCGKTNIVFI